MFKKVNTFINERSYFTKRMTLSLILGLLIFIFGAILFFIFKDLSAPKFLFKFISGSVTVLGIFFSTAITILQFLKKESKSDINVTEILKKFLSFMIVCIIPFVVSCGLSNAIDSIDTKDATESSGIGALSNSNNVYNSVSEFVFDFTFDDTLFSKYSYSELNENKDSLKIKIKEKIFQDLIYNNGKLPDEYKIKTKQADDFERTYIFMCENNIFDEHHNTIRISMLENSIVLRKEANDYYSNFANQRLIVLRYIDLKDEYIKNQNTKISLVYSSIINWSLISAQTAYIENKDDIKKTYDMLCQIANIYNEYARTFEFNSESYKKANLLCEVYEDIVQEIS